MKLTITEKKMMKKRLNQLRKYMISSLKKNKLDDYLNMANSRELNLLEYALIKNSAIQAASS